MEIREGDTVLFEGEEYELLEIEGFHAVIKNAFGTYQVLAKDIKEIVANANKNNWITEDQIIEWAKEVLFKHQPIFKEYEQTVANRQCLIEALVEMCKEAMPKLTDTVRVVLSNDAPPCPTQLPTLECIKSEKNNDTSDEVVWQTVSKDEYNSKPFSAMVEWAYSERSGWLKPVSLTALLKEKK